MIKYLEYLMENINMPLAVAVAIIVAFVVMQVIGELLEFKGKAVPEFVKIRKHFARKKQDRETITEVQKLLSEMNAHYSADNITKRDDWIKWVNDRADVYDKSLVEISEKLEEVGKAVKNNTRMAEELFVQSSRDRILDFAGKVASECSIVSREEFNRIFKVHKQYEDFLEAHDMTNGEIDVAYRIIVESYEEHIKQHSFAENVRGYE